MSLKILFSILPLESEEMEKNKIMIFFFLAGKLVFSCPRICRARFFRRAVEMRSSPNKEELQSKACAVEVRNAQYLAHADQ